MKKLIEKVVNFFYRYEKFDDFIIIFFSFVILFPMLWSQGLWDPWESCTAEVAREAAEEGRWFPLTFDGKALHALPPLFFWLIALWIKVFGTNEFVVRLLPAILFLSLLLPAKWLIKKQTGRKVSLIFSLALETSPAFYGNARHISSHLFAAMILFIALLSFFNLLVEESDKIKLIEKWFFWLLMLLSVFSAGFVSIFVIAFVIIVFVLISLSGYISLPRFKNLFLLNGVLVFVILAGLWVLYGLITGGNEFTRGLFSPQSLTFASMLSTGRNSDFAFEIRQMFVFVPAGAIWSMVLMKESNEKEKLLVILLFSVPAGILLLFYFTPQRFPVDMIFLCPEVLLIGIWGYIRFSGEDCDEVGKKFLYRLGILLIGIGCASLGVDFFWSLKRPVEVIGYVFDRPYSDLGMIVKFFYNAVAISIGGACAISLFSKKKLFPLWMAIAVSMVISLFIIHYVYQRCGENFSAKPLLISYSQKKQEGDKIATYLMDPISSGGEYYYFERNFEKLHNREEMIKFLQKVAGKGRAIFITSHVRNLYNEIFDVTCGNKLEPLNEKRKWYAITSYEGPPPTTPEPVKMNNSNEVNMDRNLEWKFYWQGENFITLMGYKLKNVELPDKKVKKKNWIDVELFFRCEKNLDISWKVFLEASLPGKVSSTSRTSVNHIPACGKYPTTDWEQGEIIRDFTRLYFPATLESGSYLIKMGFYALKGERMTVKLADDEKEKFIVPFETIYLN